MKEIIRKALIAMPEKGASDLHLGANTPMHYRIDEELVEVDGTETLSADEVKDIVYSLFTREEIEKFENEKELDFSLEIEGVGRYRGNAFLQRYNVGCAIRLIPLRVSSLSECGLPEGVIRDFCNASKGLVLVTGATGSGKSTTLAAMVDEINSTHKCHIITVEDPIEFIHSNKKAIVDQRQILDDTHSFGNALRYALRQDPDVILIGELRDLDSIQEALIIADTGHLVLGTLHTSDAIQTINRVIDIFPAHQQRQIRVQFSFILLGIISQQLIPHMGRPGRTLASEILVATPAIRSMIREGKEHQIYSVLQTSQKSGMRTMNQALAELYSSGKITYDDAVARSANVEELLKIIV
ncbi:MAG: type IV pilus twitching motility protein PilT [Candidatus Omnitrophota bacterium]